MMKTATFLRTAIVSGISALIVCGSAFATPITIEGLGTLGGFLGSDDENDGISNVEAAAGVTGLSFLYKAEDANGEIGLLAPFLTTDKAGALPMGLPDGTDGNYEITVDSAFSDYDLYLVVKGGMGYNVYDITGWDQIMPITVLQSSSYEGKGISHISIYGTAVPEGGATIAMLGLALLGLRGMQKLSGKKQS